MENILFDISSECQCLDIKYFYLFRVIEKFKVNNSFKTIISIHPDFSISHLFIFYN